LQAKRSNFSKTNAIVDVYFRPIVAEIKELDPNVKNYSPDFCNFVDESMKGLPKNKNDNSLEFHGKAYYYRYTQ
jgi:hypothetical protein